MLHLSVFCVFQLSYVFVLQSCVINLILLYTLLYTAAVCDRRLIMNWGAGDSDNKSYMVFFKNINNNVNGYLT